MKNIFIGILFLIGSTISAKTYYVSTIGNDSNPGTITQPWKTFSKAMMGTNRAGDTVLFRGGVYPAEGGMVVITGGNAGNRACFFNYPGEEPIYDCKNVVPLGAAFRNDWDSGDGVGDHWQMKGITIRNVQQRSEYDICNGIQLWGNPGDIILENLKIHDIDGVGITITDYFDTIWVKNCDVWNVCDSLHPTLPGQNGVGIQWNCLQNLSGPKVYSSVLLIEGCRVWNFSDNGFAGPGEGYVEIKNSWAFNGGQLTGEGCGFKVGAAATLREGSYIIPIQRKILNCISAYNGLYGYSDNNKSNPPMNSLYHNNTAYHNGYKGYEFSGWGWYNLNYSGDRSLAPNAMKCNNISYDNEYRKYHLNYGENYYFPDDIFPENHNSWDSPVLVTDDDFLSLDWTEMLRPRKSDGSLPDIDFLKLAPGSDLIDKGIDIGLPYNGTAPDLGWNESLSGDPVPPTVNYVSSSTENATPSRIDMTFNLTLANIVPPTSAFSVTVNGSARSVNSVSISGTKVLLILASPIAYGDVVTITYSKPASNPLQTVSGGQAASFTAKSVTNNVAAVIPVYVSSGVENATPARIDLTFNLTLANIIPTAATFNVMVNGSARTVSSVSVSGTKVLLTLSSPVVYGNTVTVAYTKPASNPLQTAAGGQVVSFTAQSVTNNVAAINQPPSVEISSPTKSTSFIAPADITINAIASDVNGSIIRVEFYQGTVKLGEIISAPYSYTWKEVPEGTYSITVAATDNQNLRTVSTPVTVVVEKSSTQINQLPVVTITNPNKIKKFKKHDDIVIEAVASDPDGIVTKVELKSGNVIIAEVTSPPYTYTLRDVDTGTYRFIAIATDNFGATNSSQILELRVEDFYDGGSENVNLYPNPNNGKFEIDFLTNLPIEDHWVSIFNSNGSIIHKAKLSDSESPIKIGLNGSVPGAYVLMISSKERIYTTKKFLITR